MHTNYRRSILHPLTSQLQNRFLPLTYYLKILERKEKKNNQRYSFLVEENELFENLQENPLPDPKSRDKQQIHPKDTFLNRGTLSPEQSSPLDKTSLVPV